MLALDRVVNAPLLRVTGWRVSCFWCRS